MTVQSLTPSTSGRTLAGRRSRSSRFRTATLAYLAAGCVSLSIWLLVWSAVASLIG